MCRLQNTRPTPGSSGATLVEVLMSCMLMGIGVVTLATLFPISILRAVQASQLTNATILRHNAEAFIDVDLRLVTEPGPFATTVYHNRNYVVDPLGYAAFVTLPSTGVPLAPATPPLASVPPPPLDVLSWIDWFGNNGPNVEVPHTADRNLQRCAGLIPPVLFNEAMAASFVTLPDSWVVHFDATPLASTRTSVTLPTDIDLSQIVLRDDLNLNGQLDPWEVDRPLPPLNNGRPDSIASRILLFDASGRRCEIREITDITANEIKWTEDINGSGGLPDNGEDFNFNEVIDEHLLPADFAVERVRIVTDDRRYTWMLTVRNRGGVCSVDCVVFFRRPIGDPAEERIFRNETGDAFNTGSGNIVFVDFDVDRDNDGVVEYDEETVADELEGPRIPYLKKGSFILDAENAYWYRIQDFEEILLPSGDMPRRRRIQITLDRPAIANSNAAIFMKGIVNVFPMQTRSP